MGNPQDDGETNENTSFGETDKETNLIKMNSQNETDLMSDIEKHNKTFSKTTEATQENADAPTSTSEKQVAAQEKVIANGSQNITEEGNSALITKENDETKALSSEKEVSDCSPNIDRCDQCKDNKMTVQDKENRDKMEANVSDNNHEKSENKLAEDRSSLDTNTDDNSVDTESKSSGSKTDQKISDTKEMTTKSSEDTTDTNDTSADDVTGADKVTLLTSQFERSVKLVPKESECDSDVSSQDGRDLDEQAASWIDGLSLQDDEPRWHRTKSGSMSLDGRAPIGGVATGHGFAHNAPELTQFDWHQPPPATMEPIVHTLPENLFQCTYGTCAGNQAVTPYEAAGGKHCLDPDDGAWSAPSKYMNANDQMLDVKPERQAVENDEKKYLQPNNNYYRTNSQPGMSGGIVSEQPHTMAQGGEITEQQKLQAEYSRLNNLLTSDADGSTAQGLLGLIESTGGMGNHGNANYDQNTAAQAVNGMHQNTAAQAISGITTMHQNTPAHSMAAFMLEHQKSSPVMSATVYNSSQQTAPSGQSPRRMITGRRQLPSDQSAASQPSHQMAAQTGLTNMQQYQQGAALGMAPEQLSQRQQTNAPAPNQSKLAEILQRRTPPQPGMPQQITTMPSVADNVYIDPMPSLMSENGALNGGGYSMAAPNLGTPNVINHMAAGMAPNACSGQMNMTTIGQNIGSPKQVTNNGGMMQNVGSPPQIPLNVVQSQALPNTGSPAMSDTYSSANQTFTTNARPPIESLIVTAPGSTISPASYRSSDSSYTRSARNSQMTSPASSQMPSPASSTQAKSPANSQLFSPAGSQARSPEYYPEMSPGSCTLDASPGSSTYDDSVFNSPDPVIADSSDQVTPDALGALDIISAAPDCSDLALDMIPSPPECTELQHFEDILKQHNIHASSSGSELADLEILNEMLQHQNCDDMKPDITQLIHNELLGNDNDSRRSVSSVTSNNSTGSLVMDHQNNKHNIVNNHINNNNNHGNNFVISHGNALGNHSNQKGVQKIDDEVNRIVNKMQPLLPKACPDRSNITILPNPAILVPQPSVNAVVIPDKQREQEQKVPVVPKLDIVVPADINSEEESRALIYVSNLSMERLRYEDDEKDTLLHIAVYEHKPYLLRALLARLKRENILADFINAKNTHSQTPLYMALLSDPESDTDPDMRPLMVQDLLNYGADVNLSCFHGHTNSKLETMYQSSLHLAASLCNAGLLSQLLQADSSGVNTQNTAQYTPLHCAVQKHGVMLNGQIRDCHEVIQVLVSHGADLGAKAKAGYTIFHMIADDKWDVKLLTFVLSLPRRGDQLVDIINRKDDAGNTVLHILLGWSQRLGGQHPSVTPQRTQETLEEMLTRFLDKGADPKIRDSRNRAPQVFAKETKLINMLKAKAAAATTKGHPRQSSPRGSPAPGTPSSGFGRHSTGSSPHGSPGLCNQTVPTLLNHGNGRRPTAGSHQVMSQPPTQPGGYGPGGMSGGSMTGYAGNIPVTVGTAAAGSSRGILTAGPPQRLMPGMQGNMS